MTPSSAQNALGRNDSTQSCDLENRDDGNDTAALTRVSHGHGTVDDDDDDDDDSNSDDGVIDDNEPLCAAFLANTCWKPGQTIRILSFSKDENVLEKVESYAEEWTKHANLKFVFVTCKNEPSDIRITFKSGGSWCYVGTRALRCSPPEPTMNLDFGVDPSEEHIKQTVLHEFGHAIGLIHEHSSPEAKIDWDHDATMKHYGSNYHWSKKSVRANVLRKYKAGTCPICSPFDQDSIMLYDFNKSVTRNGWSSTSSFCLSETDKKFAAKAYPWTDQHVRRDNHVATHGGLDANGGQDFQERDRRKRDHAGVRQRFLTIRKSVPK
ncbi:zincin [Schizopora paradoxa]|uniref:Zincin n=1 Tax=Schizopora paradoxa TaxID=27342 RepID=A0A0H2SFB8_9AGAM|nr:zincin [Schizopora paradoxa]